MEQRVLRIAGTQLDVDPVFSHVDVVRIVYAANPVIRPVPFINDVYLLQVR